MCPLSSIQSSLGPLTTSISHFLSLENFGIASFFIFLPAFDFDLFKELKFNFPYLYDETQEVAKLLKAECTPEFYLYDKLKKLVYRGRLDGSSPGNDLEIDGKDLRSAVNALISGKKINTKQFPSMGCNIKWK